MVKPTNKFNDGIAIPFFSKPAVTAPHRANTEPTDKSIPAVSIINVKPTAMQMFTEICRITFKPFAMVKNLSDNNANTMHSTNNAMSDCNFPKLILFNAIAIF
jgi:hypothetical protein